MKDLLKRIKDVAARFNILSLRERILVLISLLVMLQLGWTNWFWGPLRTEQEMLGSQIAVEEEKLASIKLQLEGAVDRSRFDPNKGLRRQLDSLQTELDTMEWRIREAAGALIDPSEMVRFLEDMLERNGNLRLVRLEKLKTESLTEPQSDDKVDKDVVARPQLSLYRHGFLVEFEGDYFSTLNYLENLEALPWKFFWDGVEFRVMEYPKARVQIWLHTLSFDEGWVSA